MLAGQITGRCISLADIRDVVGNLQYGDYGMATVSAIGLAPGGGGDAKTGGKDAKFALKNVDNVPEVAKGLGLRTKRFPA